MTYIVLDTETNGLPDRTNLPFGVFPKYNEIHRYNSARIVQLSFMICDDNMNELEKFDFIIKNNDKYGFNITNPEFHNITNKISQNNGIDFIEAYNVLHKYLDNCKAIIAHNINFDINVIKSELFRRNYIDYIVKFSNCKAVCSMVKYKFVVKAINKKTGYIKNPSLAELYEFAFKEDNLKIENAHNSLYDVITLQKSMKKIGFNIS
tara:strand:+ start:2698 stop:3318 length:621 start_codon:yes stop_codon:yes gene_type:complete